MIEASFKRSRTIWHTHWLLRWVVWNSLGWTLGLFLATLLIRWFGGWGMLVSGLVLGACASFSQTIPLDLPRQRWVFASALAGWLATLPIYGLSATLLIHWQIGLFLMGMVFGGSVGFAQARILNSHHPQGFLWWVGACALGGALCAPLTLFASEWTLPVMLAPGPPLYGLITGWVFLRLFPTENAPTQAN